ncbi:MAG TPA: hypothetical protein VF508_10665 [Pyrinomonadaceae bacterium]|jgi:hypothetical protein
MPAKNTFQSIRVRGPAQFDQAIRVKGQDWPPEESVGAEELAALLAGKLDRAANLADLASAAAARVSLALGSAATLNAPAAGDAAAGELVKGSDSRLTNARAPLAHQHAAGDITSGQLPDARIASAAAWSAKGEPNAAAMSVLAATFDLTAALNTDQDTGLYVDLPAAGTYVLMADVRCSVNISAGAYGYIVASLYNTTDGAKVANSESLAVYTETTGKTFSGTATIVCVVTVAAAKRIKLYAHRGAPALNFTYSQVVTLPTGRTRLSYLKVL